MKKGMEHGAWGKQPFGLRLLTTDDGPRTKQWSEVRSQRSDLRVSDLWLLASWKFLPH